MVTDDEVDIAAEAYTLCPDYTQAIRAALEAVDAHREELHKAYLKSIRDEIAKEA